MEKVSVIIPVYRVERFIERCLLSVLSQTYRNIEIVLVDDCGGDNSVDVARDFLSAGAADMSYKVVTHSDNRGLSAARNTGIVNSSGKYVYFLDGDDEITPDCIGLLVEAMEKNDGIDMAIAGMKRRFPNGDMPCSEYENEIIATTAGIIRAFDEKKIVWNAVNRLIKKDFFDKNGLFFTEGITSEDMLWNFETLPFLNKIALLSEITYIYYYTEDSIMTSASRNRKFAMDYLSIIDKMQRVVQIHPIPELIAYYQRLKYRFIPFAILWHGFPDEVYTLAGKKIYADRFSDFYGWLPFALKVKFLMPVYFLIKYDRLAFKCSGYVDAFKHKFKIGM